MKIPIALQIAVLTVALTGLYTMVGQSVPQKEVHPPVVIELPDDISSAEMVEIGKEIFDGKGICKTCHTIGKSGALRFPDLNGIATRAATRRPGFSALDYIAESLYEPDIFIVDGFNPGMPVINKPPIGLTDQEILTVIAYLQTLGGEATVTMDTRLVYTGGSLGDGDAAPAVDDAMVAAAADATPLVAYGCSRGGCHDADPPNPEAPTLVGIGARLDRDQLLLELVRHPGEDGLDQVTLAELETLAQTLSEMRGEG